MAPLPVVVGGPPGSGKTTAARGAAERLGLAYHAAGALFRAEGERRGMDVVAFNRFAETHPEVDRELDERMVALARPGALLDSRIAAPLARRQGVALIAVAVTARPEVRAVRLAHRDGVSVEAARVEIAAREASERTRYRTLYGIDLDRPGADLEIDSSELDAAEVTRRVVEFVRAAPPGPRP